MARRDPVEGQPRMRAPPPVGGRWRARRKRISDGALRLGYVVSVVCCSFFYGKCLGWDCVRDKKVIRIGKLC